MYAGLVTSHKNLDTSLHNQTEQMNKQHGMLNGAAHVSGLLDGSLTIICEKPEQSSKQEACD